MNPEQWLSLKWNGGSTMSDRWLNQSKIIHFFLPYFKFIIFLAHFLCFKICTILILTIEIFEYFVFLNSIQYIINNIFYASFQILLIPFKVILTFT